MIIKNVADALEKTYDFVIAGGGTAGLTLAARLSENPSFTVAVLEAGDYTIDDPMTLIPARYGQYFDDPKYDWAFKTIEQKYSNGREVPWPRGKGLGGSSTINFLVWSLPPVIDVDAFEKLGNHGWNWAEYFRCSKQVQKVQEASNHLSPSPSRNNRVTCGVHTTMPSHLHPLDDILRTSFRNKGIKFNDDPYKGDVNGTWIASSTIDPGKWTRSSAATAYLSPVQDRPNLTILTQALVSRVTFSDNRREDLTVTGVEFVHQGKTYALGVRKEVILSAGTIKDPQILELSGIGRPEILSKIGVETMIELPGVGENLQEHNLASIEYELNPAVKYREFDLLQNPMMNRDSTPSNAPFKDLITRLSSFTFFPFTDARTPSAVEVTKKIEKDLDEYRNTPGITPGLKDQLDVQTDIFHSDASPDIEFAAIRCDSKLFLLTFLVHPLSRGSIHSRSNNSEDSPDIDPCYFEKDSDLEILVEGIKYLRSLAETEPLKSSLVGENLQPGPQCISDEAVRDYIKNTHLSAGHALGTCSMLPRDKNGVVDPKLKVYGTKNLRVVDLSIVPLQIAAHTQATAYIIGEKAAEFIIDLYQ